MRITSFLLVAFLFTGCIRVPATIGPQIEGAERSRYAADTTGEGFGTGELRQRIVDRYDNQGIVVFSEYRDADDEVQMRFISIVENGLKTRTDWRRKDESLALFVLYAYDEQNRLIETKQYDPDGTLQRGFQSEWSDDGRRRETGPLPAAGEQFEPNSFYRLNAEGDELELLEFPAVDSLRTLFTYEYPARDAYGNWTMKLTRRDGVPTQVEIRQITYRDSP